MIHIDRLYTISYTYFLETQYFGYPPTYLPKVSKILNINIMNKTNQSGLSINLSDVLFVVPGNTVNVKM